MSLPALAETGVGLGECVICEAEATEYYVNLPLCAACNVTAGNELVDAMYTLDRLAQALKRGDDTVMIHGDVRWFDAAMVFLERALLGQGVNVNRVVDRARDVMAALQVVN